MRRVNSVGGHRMYPSTPAESDRVASGIAIISQFSEGLDRLNCHRELTPQQLSYVQSLDSRSDIAQKYRRLMHCSDAVWSLALEKQRQMAQMNLNGPYSTEEVGEGLIACANAWQEFKESIDQAIGS